jgi:hypothetical protein
MSFWEIWHHGGYSSSELTKTIGINSVVGGTLTASSPPDPAYPGDNYYSEDWNLVGVIVGQDVTVTETSSDFSVWVEVLDATDLDNPLEEDSDPITFTPLTGVNYVIRASTENEDEVGDYVLTTVSNALPILIDSYSETNQSHTYDIGAMFGNEVGQSFKVGTGGPSGGEDGGVLNSVKFYLNSHNVPSGDCFAKIYAEDHATAFGVDSLPATPAALAVSDPVDSALIGDSFVLVTFTFSGINKITLIDGGEYCVSVSYGGTNSVEVGIDRTTLTALGNGFYRDNAANWHVIAAEDTIFYVYKDA